MSDTKCLIVLGSGRSEGKAQFTYCQGALSMVGETENYTVSAQLTSSITVQLNGYCGNPNEDQGDHQAEE